MRIRAESLRDRDLLKPSNMSLNIFLRLLVLLFIKVVLFPFEIIEKQQSAQNDEDRNLAGQSHCVAEQVLNKCVCDQCQKSPAEIQKNFIACAFVHELYPFVDSFFHIIGTASRTR